MPMIKLVIFQVLSNQLWAYRFIHRDVYHLVENNEDFENLSSFYWTGDAAGPKIYRAFVDAGL